ncbi:PAS domain S-box-containing protein [Pedobacter steynii]|uniref:PAS domain S-box-containing protein n=1 Tax=Pedobacter steynii TaxID=430522 RepID=A0A1G9T400_9SPHI|nr:PAS domain S-box protein [Pedobacter steynii]NQX37244.1 PAS domain S-box protein [Pedobacter steynii]SDM42453.1 PAS domain S-box-containing protein [Pedobacter steynii]
MGGVKLYWKKYRKAIEHVIPVENQFTLFRISSWRVMLFRNTITYCLPVSLVGLVLFLIHEFMTGRVFFPVFMVIVVILLMGFVINRKIELDYRMVIVVILLYLIALIYLIFVGSDGPGALYLLIITFFTAMIFPPKATYIPLIINTLICIGIGLVIKFHIFPTPLSDTYDLTLWVAYSVNLIFVSFVSVLMISSILNGFEKTRIKEVMLLKKLDASERYYRNVFDSNPVPMYIFELNTGNFLKVNDAAVKKYGYSKEEFLSMNITKIRPTSEISKLMDIFSTIKTRTYSGILTHMNKEGQSFPVEIDTNIVSLDGVDARLVLATDVSKRVNYVRMIEKQNQDFKDIAWIQSHKVRAPLTNIMSLTEMMLQNPHGDHIDLLYMLKESTTQLNETIESIVHQAEENQIPPE